MPKMRHGPSTMLTALANHSTRIAMAASPAARKMALIRNSSRTLPLRADHHTREIGARAHDLGTRAHRPQQRGSRRNRHRARDDAGQHADQDRLDGGARRRVGVLLADAPRHRRRRANRQPHRDRVNDGHQRLGDADGGDRVRAEPADEEDVRHREHRLHQHLEHHRHGQQDDGAADRRLRVVLVGAFDRLAQRRPESGRRLHGHGRRGLRHPPSLTDDRS